MTTTISLTPERQALAAMIDHTLLKPEATASQVRRLCEEAQSYGFAAVCVNSVWVPLCVEQLRSKPGNVKIAATIGFPLGAMGQAAKTYEAQWCMQAGANELDMVIHVGALLDQDYPAVEADIEGVVLAAHAAGGIAKVIIETALLTDEQKTVACSLAKSAGADFVKTSTGFGPSGATTADVSLMRRAVGLKLGVKAAGGIRTLEDAKAMIAAGANRIGASAGIRIVTT